MNETTTTCTDCASVPCLCSFPRCTSCSHPCSEPDDLGHCGRCRALEAYSAANAHVTEQLGISVHRDAFYTPLILAYEDLVAAARELGRMER